MFYLNKYRHIGELCKKEKHHEYKKTGKSLRYKNGNCVGCQIEKMRKWVHSNRERFRELQRKIRAGRSEERRLNDKKYQQKYYQEKLKPKRAAEKMERKGKKK